MDTTGHLTESNLWLNRARHALKMGDAKASISILKKLTERGYRNPAVYEIMSRAHLQLGHNKEAIMDAITCTELCPEWYPAYFHNLFFTIKSSLIINS
jgi:predicted Zn-dependent protease